MHDNYSDADSKVQKLPSVFVCHEFFPEASVVRKSLIRETKPKAFLRIVDDIAQQVQDEAALAQKGVLQDKSELIAETKGAQRKSMAAKARVARTNASAARKRTRVVSLSTT